MGGGVPRGHVDDVRRRPRRLFLLPHAGAHRQATCFEDATTTTEKRERESSDFLAYQNAVGQYADFHSLRHTFITNLARAGVPPKVAQDLARHSDINLTLSRYSHTVIADQAEALKVLPDLSVISDEDHGSPATDVA